MNPWIAGRIVETVQQEARKQGAQARQGRLAGAPEPRRKRVGLAVSRLGLRIAGRPDFEVAPRPKQSPPPPLTPPRPVGAAG